MLIGYGMPAVQAVAIAGGTWLTADGGAALYDGKPARRARIKRTGALAITLTMAEAIAPGIVAVLGLNVPVGTTVRAGGATAKTVRVANGAVCAWLFPTSTAASVTLRVEIDTQADEVEVGEIAVFRSVDVGIKDGWTVAPIDSSVHSRTRAGQLNTVPGALYRHLTAALSARDTEVVRNGGLPGGVDWDALADQLSGRRRGCVVPQYRDMLSKAFDPVLAARSAIYGYASQLPAAENVSRQYFSGYLEFEEIPG